MIFPEGAGGVLGAARSFYADHAEDPPGKSFKMHL